MKNLKALILPLLLTASFSLQAQASGSWAENKYNSLTSPELLVRFNTDGAPTYGAGTQQKEEGENFCRKTQIVYPGAQPSYVCYTKELDGADAARVYESAPTKGIPATFLIDDEPRVGSSWREKYVVDPNTNENFLCVKTAPVIPHPVPTYRCYTNLPPMGGGISVGN